MKINSLFRRFIIQSIISFLITGTLLGLFISRSIIDQEIEHNIEIVSLTLGHSLEHWFESVNINRLSSYDIENLDEEFVSLHELGNIADIRIWNTHRELVYSQDKSLIGTIKLELDQFEKFHDNLTDYKLTTATAEENIPLKNLGDEFITIYLPIHDQDEGLIGVFEVYRLFDNSRVTINDGIRLVIIILSVGLFILYFLLARTIYNSSNKLIHQNDAIKLQANELKHSYEKLSELYRSVIRAITNAIDARDKFTSGHSQRVSKYTVAFAKHLRLDTKTIDQLEIAALLHDIGKLGVPEIIINKTEKLTQDEFDLIQQHPIIGEKIVHDIDVLQNTIDVIKYHHEQYSGKGYPSGLSMNQIPYAARIVALTDAYDAMTSDRPYRKALSKDKAISEIYKNKGIQFDPELASKFIDFIERI